MPDGMPATADDYVFVDPGDFVINGLEPLDGQPDGFEALRGERMAWFAERLMAREFFAEGLGRGYEIANAVAAYRRTGHRLLIWPGVVAYSQIDDGADGVATLRGIAHAAPQAVRDMMRAGTVYDNRVAPGASVWPAEGLPNAASPAWSYGAETWYPARYAESIDVPSPGDSVRLEPLERTELHLAQMLRFVASQSAVGVAIRPKLLFGDGTLSDKSGGNWSDDNNNTRPQVRARFEARWGTDGSPWVIEDYYEGQATFAAGAKTGTLADCWYEWRPASTYRWRVVFPGWSKYVARVAPIYVLGASASFLRRTDLFTGTGRGTANQRGFFVGAWLTPDETGGVDVPIREAAWQMVKAFAGGPTVDLLTWLRTTGSTTPQVDEAFSLSGETVIDDVISATRRIVVNDVYWLVDFSA